MSRLWAQFGQDFEVEAQTRFWSWSLVSILLLILGWGYEDYSWSRFWCQLWSRFWISSLVEMLMFGWDFEVRAWLRFWRWNLIKICVWTCFNFGKQNSTLWYVVPLTMFRQLSLFLDSQCQCHDIPIIWHSFISFSCHSCVFISFNCHF